MATENCVAKITCMLRKLFSLYIRMLRYRVAIMLILFFLLGAVRSIQPISFSYQYILIAVILASSYVAATTINDISDKDIDQINHPKTKGRPLITGEAKEKDLYMIHIFAVCVALFLAALLEYSVFLLTALAIVINYVYSVPPLRISYNTFGAPLLLSVAYVAIPYLLGMQIEHAHLGGQDLLFLSGLLVLFVGRILLKDFRDRKGDQKYHKPTFVLTYGKTKTCVVSFLCVLVGNVLLLLSLWQTAIYLLPFFEIFFVLIYMSGYRLWKAKQSEKEQIEIGIGAKMGNGLLISLLGVFLLQSMHAAMGTQIVFLFLLTIMYAVNFFFLQSKPGYAVIGYRG